MQKKIVRKHERFLRTIEEEIIPFLVGQKIAQLETPQSLIDALSLLGRYLYNDKTRSTTSKN